MVTKARMSGWSIPGLENEKSRPLIFGTPGMWSSVPGGANGKGTVGSHSSIENEKWAPITAALCLLGSFNREASCDKNCFVLSTPLSNRPWLFEVISSSRA